MSDKYDCANTVTFRSTPKTLGNIMTHLTGEQGVFDFNKLIPIPTELLDIKLFAIGDKDYYYSSKKYMGTTLLGPPTVEWLEDNCLDPFTLRRLKTTHGFLSRNDWCVKNWGIVDNSANASYTYNEAVVEPTTRTELTYTFDTVWSEPQPIYNALCEYVSKHDSNDNIEFQWYFDDSVQDYKGYMSLQLDQ
jgi:hypothetical protein